MIIEDYDGDKLEIISFRGNVEVGAFSERMDTGVTVYLDADQATEAARQLLDLAAQIRLEAGQC